MTMSMHFTYRKFVLTFQGGVAGYLAKNSLVCPLQKMLLQHSLHLTICRRDIHRQKKAPQWREKVKKNGEAFDRIDALE